MTRKIGLSRVLMILFVEKFEGAHKFRPCMFPIGPQP